MVSLGSVCPYIKYYCLLSGNTSAPFNRSMLRDSSMAATLASSVHIPANLQTAPIPVLEVSLPTSGRLVYRSTRSATTLLPSLFLRSKVCSEIVKLSISRLEYAFPVSCFFKKSVLVPSWSLSPSPMLGRMELCLPNNIPFSSPLCWENVETGCLTCCHLHTFPGQT